MDLSKAALAHLDDVLAEGKRLAACPEEEHSDLSNPDGIRLITRARAAIRRVAGENSPYTQQAEEIIANGGYHTARLIVAVVDSLRTDVAGGFVATVAELIHGEVFGDFLEMAQHLLDEQYKDAAAVIAGSSLEGHLRQLCEKHGLSTEIGSTGIRAKKADLINSDLARANAYSKGDQKSVSAWLDLRNKAAHGHYSEYQAQQVELLIASVRDFIARNPG